MRIQFSHFILSPYLQHVMTLLLGLESTHKQHTIAYPHKTMHCHQRLWKHARTPHNFKSIRRILLSYITQSRKFRQPENEMLLTLASQLNPATATARMNKAVIRPMMRTSLASSTINKSQDCKQNENLLIYTTICISLYRSHTSPVVKMLASLLFPIKYFNGIGIHQCRSSFYAPSPD